MKRRIKCCVIILIICFGQIVAQTNYSLRSSQQGYIIGGLGVASGAHLGLKINASNNSSLSLTYGVLPLQDFFGIKTSIITFGYNHYLYPERSSSPFANIGLGFFRAQSSTDNKRQNAIIISPNFGFDYLFNKASVCVKLGLIAAFSKFNKPKSTVNFEFGFAQQLW